MSLLKGTMSDCYIKFIFIFNESTFLEKGEPKLGSNKVDFGSPFGIRNCCTASILNGKRCL